MAGLMTMQLPISHDTDRTKARLTLRALVTPSRDAGTSHDTDVKVDGARSVRMRPVYA
ncbi:hypothetical protein PhaeoP83_00869 [Phaeobacter inhibens]|uniref:Uncharacterized protein n=1 Tax=Phaeobacter inhibens TaxID=221822 RepID=A0ABN5GLT7_9RHOB|nr:hypothetical protein PhaeoP83_00869 [Phaeobacter inhibens]AUQ93666.1 hypothetical protein PhaeoP66_00862 [Phaeobacter inhibens]AUR04466.1 hypothetical protein PhaeoP72_02508 [Phaeobacter inhibens]AUR18969.1 hypothetical protein PhaeoP80_00869 [Phaeobacter inhibens]